MFGAMQSTKDRTLDQQCTVTRPGISLIASGLAVELMVSVLQHPDRGNAAAEIESPSSWAEEGASGTSSETQLSPLGVVPHSIRGFLYRHQQVLPATEAFYNCTACSPLVLERYAQDGYAFLLDVFNTPDCLERVSGLEELHRDISTSAVEVRLFFFLPFVFHWLMSCVFEIGLGLSGRVGNIRLRDKFFEYLWREFKNRG